MNSIRSPRALRGTRMHGHQELRFVSGVYPMTLCVDTVDAGTSSLPPADLSRQPDGVSGHLDQFLHWLAMRHTPPKDVTTYSHDLQRFIESCGEKFDAMKPEEVECYVKQLAQSGLGFTTLKRTRREIREFFSFLIDTGVATKNPVAMVKITPVQMDALTPDHVASLFRYLARRQESSNSAISLRYKRDELILWLMTFFGVRQYRIPTLKLSSIIRTRECLILRVTDRFLVHLPEALLYKLRHYLSIRKSASDIIFLDPLDGNPISPRTVNALLRELKYRFDIGCSPVAIYHTFLHLQAHPEEKDQLASRLFSTGSHGQFSGDCPSGQSDPQVDPLFLEKGVT